MRILLAAAASAALIAAGPAASAAGFRAAPSDTRPCATHREVWITGSLTRADLEKRWEVTGLGVRVSVPAVGAGWAYPICDRDFSDQFAFAQFSGGYVAYVGIVTQ